MRTVTADDYLAALQREVGYREGAGNRTKFGAAMGADGLPWCASFLCAVGRHVFGTKDVIGWTAATGVMLQAAAAAERTAVRPARGAIAYRRRTGGGHVGAVTTVGNGVVSTIEGNTDDAKGSTGGQVMLHVSKWGRWNEWLFPRYPLPPQGVSRGDRNPFVADLQRLIGGLTVDGDFGPLTFAALSAWQKQRGLQGLGTWGPRSVAVAADAGLVVPL